MAHYRIAALRRDTGAAETFTFEAPSEKVAVTLACDRGFFVEAVEELTPNEVPEFGQDRSPAAPLNSSRFARRDRASLSVCLTVVVIVVGVGVISSVWSRSRHPLPSKPTEQSVSPAAQPLGQPGARWNVLQTVVAKGKYDQIMIGMSYRQVVGIIGVHGEELARNRIDGVPGVMGDVETVMYMWQNPDGSNMNAMFQNDRLFQKAQFGLR